MSYQFQNLYNKDDRYLPRFEVKNRVSFQLSDDEEDDFEGKTKDLSCAGVCICVAKGFFPSSKKMNLQIHFQDDMSIDLTGNIVWLKECPDRNEIGVMFYNTSEKTQEMILQHAFEVDRQTVVKQWFKGWDGKQ